MWASASRWRSLQAAIARRRSWRPRSTAPWDQPGALLTDDGRLNLIARETLTILGETAIDTLGLPATTQPGGSLNDVDLTSRQGASDAL